MNSIAPGPPPVDAIKKVPSDLHFALVCKNNLLPTFEQNYQLSVGNMFPLYSKCMMSLCQLAEVPAQTCQ